MVSTIQEFTYNSPIPPGPYVTSKKPSARKSLHQLSEVLDVKKKTDTLMLFSDKPNRKAILSGIMLWYSTPKRRGHTKINERVKKYFFISTTSSGCAVPNRKLLSKIIHWRSHRDTVSYINVISDIGQRNP